MGASGGLPADLGTSGTDYYRTTQQFDSAGRPNKTVTPTGTIYRTVYDYLGRVVSQWVGTNDTPGSGYWSPSNNTSPSNMVDVQDNYYDNQYAPDTPTLTAGTGGSLAAGTYYVKITYVINSLETPASIEKSVTVAASGKITVTAPASVTGGSGYNVYLSTTSGQEVLQNGGTPVSFGTNKVLTSLTTGTAAVPMIAGDSNLTRVVQHVDSSSADDRVTINEYDWRDRLVMTKSGVQVSEDSTTHRPIAYYTYDNLGEVIETQQYDGDTVKLVTLGYTAGVPNAPSSSLLRAQTCSSYDDRGNVYETLVYGVDPGEQAGHTAGTVSSSGLATDYFYDSRGNLAAQFDPGGLVTKYAYDGADRVTTEYQGDGGVIALGLATAKTLADATTISNDVVLDQVTYTYDGDGNVIFTVHKQRDDNAGTTGGALGDPSTAPKARVSYEAFYYDGANRPTDDVNYGTNGSVAVTRPSTPVATIVGTASAGTTTTLTDSTGLTSTVTNFYVGYLLTITAGTDNGKTATVTAYDATNHKITFAAFSSAIDSSSQYTLTSPALVTHTDYNVQGLPYQVTDPRGLVTLTSYDLLGRVTQTIAGAVKSGGLYSPMNATNQTTNYYYDGNDHVVKMEALLSGSAVEDTAYVYGVGSTIGTDLFSNDLIAKVEYPDQSTGVASTSSSNDQSFSYDWQGDEGSFTDQNATVHTYSYDLLGRLTTDAVTLGSGSAVDSSVLARTYSYETQGQLYQATARTGLGSGSTVVNQDQFAYDQFGRVAVEYQEHNGAVNTGSSASVQYNHTEMSGGANNDRLTSMVYPNGRQLNYKYDSSGSIDDTVSRVGSLQDNAGTCSGTALESYKYLGLDTIVERDRQNGLNLTYISGSAGGDGGDQYQGLDRFGRVVAQNWVSGSTSKDSFQYGYDQNSNALYKKNLLSASNSELYHANAASAGDSYTAASGNGYDAFNRLTNFRRGTLSASSSNYGNLDTVTNTALATSTGSVKSWSLDAQGNWNSSAAGTGNGTNSPAAPTSTSRTINRQNQVTAVSGSSLGYDNNGNLM
ncbi:MAG: repeat-associated core domain protein, partial [Actinomycetia bacterium]|nr:repeat-associated core domain protein [Actinomycetes bacterium]